jgi:hypothetical protein
LAAFGIIAHRVVWHGLLLVEVGLNMDTAADERYATANIGSGQPIAWSTRPGDELIPV